MNQMRMKRLEMMMSLSLLVATLSGVIFAGSAIIVTPARVSSAAPLYISLK